MLPVILSDEANADLVSAGQWYDQQRHGLGADFAEAIEQTLGRIARGPENPPIVFRNSRMALTPPFPYCVYYRVDADQIWVQAIIHPKRHPRVWKSRI